MKLDPKEEALEWPTKSSITVVAFAHAVKQVVNIVPKAPNCETPCSKFLKGNTVDPRTQPVEYMGKK